MQEYRILRNKILFLSLAAFVGMTSVAVAQYEIPAAQQQGNVVYITGGIGEGERDAIDSVRNDYNLHLTGSSADGAFVGTNTVSISDKSGNEVLNAQAGPIFFAKLPAGKYTVTQRTAEGAEQSKSVTLAKSGSRTLHFIW